MPSFIIRKIDDDLWEQFKARAEAEGHSLKWLMLYFIRSYIEHGKPKAGK